MIQKQARFHLYRYQILPIERQFQGDFIYAKTIDELIARKNQFFFDVLKNTKLFSKRTSTITKTIYVNDELAIYRIGADRSISRETKEFKEETLENWPSVLMAIWNRPDKQLIAIQHRPTAFTDTDAVMRIVIGSLRGGLTRRQLVLKWEPLFESRHFWELVKKHEGKVQEVSFEFVTPNMSNISQDLSEELKAFAKATNSADNKLVIHSDPKSSLNITKENDSINGLVNYSSEGGGQIKMKVKGMTKKVSASDVVKEVEIDELALQGSAEDIAKILKALLDE
ncbi:MAG: hypothetical protein WC696_06130 [Candidatus Methylopumilus sp.]|jgi:hypothetical protein